MRSSSWRRFILSLLVVAAFGISIMSLVISGTITRIGVEVKQPNDKTFDVVRNGMNITSDSTKDIEKNEHSMRDFIMDPRYPHIRLAVTQDPKRLEEENSKEICVRAIFEDTKNLKLQNSQPIELTLFDSRNFVDSTGVVEGKQKDNYRTWCEKVASHRYRLASGYTDTEGKGRRTFYRVVVGIPSVDTGIGARRRALQRQTWHQFPEIHKMKSYNVYNGASDPNIGQGIDGHPIQHDDGAGGSNAEGVSHGNINQHNNKRKRMQKTTRDTMLVRYIIARHPRKDYIFSDTIVIEAQQHRDVLLIEMDEVKVTTSKEFGIASHWGLAAEVGMSRKALYWYILGPLIVGGSDYFDYIMKGDDDMFLLTPVFMHDLMFRVEPAARRMEYIREREILQESTSDEQLDMIRRKEKERCLHPRALSLLLRRPDPPLVYWGKMMKWGAVKGVPNSNFVFIGGMSIVMSKQVVKLLTHHSPQLYNKSGPFNYAEGSAEQVVKTMYKADNMDHEDVMVGRALYKLANRSRPPLALGHDKPVTAVGQYSRSDNYQDFDLEEKWNVSSDDVRWGDGDDPVTNCDMNEHSKYAIHNSTIPRIGIYSAHSKSPTADIFKALGIVSFNDCRFHDVDVYTNVRDTDDKSDNDNSLVIHHLENHQYVKLMAKYKNVNRTQTVRDATKQRQQRSNTRIMKGLFAGHVVVNIC